LLDRLGVFGVRLALTFVRSGMRDPTALSEELVRRSGLNEVRQILATQFTERSGVLKARSALLAVERLLRQHPRAGTESIEAQVERIVAGSHQFRELALISALRSSRVSFAPFGPDETAAAERLLGAAGTAAHERLGLDPTATDTEMQSSTMEAVRLWRTRAESPLIDRETAAACHVVARSCEGILSAL
jgi:hypothetical protein